MASSKLAISNSWSNSWTSNRIVGLVLTSNRFVGAGFEDPDGFDSLASTIWTGFLGKVSRISCGPSSAQWAIFIICICVFPMFPIARWTRLWEGFCPYLARNVIARISWLLVANGKSCTSQKFSCWCMLYVHPQTTHLFDWEDNRHTTLPKHIYRSSHPTSRALLDFLLDMWLITICKWNIVVASFFGEFSSENNGDSNMLLQDCHLQILNP